MVWPWFNPDKTQLGPMPPQWTMWAAGSTHALGSPSMDGGSSGDATMPVTRPLGGQGGPPGGGDDGGGWDDGEGEGDRRRMWFIAGGVLAVGLIVGALIAVPVAAAIDLIRVEVLQPRLDAD